MQEPREQRVNARGDVLKMNRLQRFEIKKRFQELTVFSTRAARRIQVLEGLRCAFQIRRGQFMGLTDV